MCMAKLESYPSMLITLVQKHHDIYIRRIVCNTLFENGHMHWLGGDASVNGGGKSGHLQRFLQLYNLENGKVDSFVRHCWLLVWKSTGMSAMGMGDLASNLLPECRFTNNLWESFFSSFRSHGCTKIIDDQLILDLLKKNLRYNFSPKTTAGRETL